MGVKAGEERVKQEQFFQSIIKQAAEMIIVYEAGGKILYVNPAAENMLKYAEDLKLRNIVDIFPMEESRIDNPQKQLMQEQEFMI